MFCVNCGKEIPEDHLFCTHCGANQEQKESTPPTAKTSVEESTTKSDNTVANEQAKKARPSIVVVGIVAIAVVIALFLLFGKSSGYKNYKDLVGDYFTAISKESFKDLLRCYDKEDQKDLKEDKKDIVEELEELSEFLEDKYDRGWQKKIDVKSRTRIGSDDGVTTYTVLVEIDGSRAEYLSIKKYKNKYYIDSTNDYF